MHAHVNFKPGIAWAMQKFRERLKALKSVFKFLENEITEEITKFKTYKQS